MAHTIHCQAYSKYRCSRKGPAEWLDGNAELWKVVLPVAETQALLELPADSQWKPHFSQIQKVVGSGSLGMKLFGFALQVVIGEVVEETITKTIAPFLLQETFSTDDYTLATARCLEAVMAIENIDTLPDRRTIIVRYRKWPVQIKVNCVQDEVAFRLAAAVRGQAVETGALQLLMCEDVGGSGSAKCQLPFSTGLKLPGGQRTPMAGA